MDANFLCPTTSLGTPSTIVPPRDEADEIEALRLDQIEGKSYVGGLVKSFERRAA